MSHFPSFVVPVFHQKFQQLVESFVSVHSILLSCLLSPSSLCVALIRLHLLNYPLELIKQFRQPLPAIRLCFHQFPYLDLSCEHAMLACILSLKSSTFRFVNLVCVSRLYFHLFGDLPPCAINILFALDQPIVISSLSIPYPRLVIVVLTLFPLKLSLDVACTVLLLVFLYCPLCT